MNHFLRWIFFAVAVRPFVLIVMGVNVRHAHLIPEKGPAILVANHNSHLDTAVLMTLFPHSLLPHLRPVAAADYFTKNRTLRWFALKLVGIIPIVRDGSVADPLEPVSQALLRGDLVIFYPEGTRGKPEHLAHFKSGISVLAQRHPEVPVVPFFMHGLGKSLPKGEGLLVPFFIDAFVGEHLYWNGDKTLFLEALQERIAGLSQEAHIPEWS